MSLTEYVAAVLAAMASVMTFVEIMPLQVKPWGRLLQQLGRAINGEVLAEVERLSAELQSLSVAFGQQQAENCRARVIRFGDELLHDELHSKEHFDQILLDISFYEQYCRDNPNFANGVAAMTIARIKQVYANCLREHNFL